MVIRALERGVFIGNLTRMINSKTTWILEMRRDEGTSIKSLRNIVFFKVGLESLDQWSSWGLENLRVAFSFRAFRGKWKDEIK